MLILNDIQSLTDEDRLRTHRMLPDLGPCYKRHGSAPGSTDRRGNVGSRLAAGAETHRFKVEVAIDLKAEGVDAIIVVVIVVLMVMP